MNMLLSLKEHRERTYLSTRELAERAGVAPATIWRVERGDFVRLRPSTMRKIAKVLAVYPSEIAEFAPKQAESDIDSTIKRVEPPDAHKAAHPSSARALLKHAGTWQGDDVEDLLKDVYASRGKVEF